MCLFLHSPRSLLLLPCADEAPICVPFHLPSLLPAPTIWFAELLFFQAQCLPCPQGVCQPSNNASPHSYVLCVPLLGVLTALLILLWLITGTLSLPVGHIQ